MALQEQLFESLKSEKVVREYNPAIPLDDIIPPKDALNPSSQLVESVQDEDLLEPLLLNAIDGRYKIISGRRRYLAAVEAGHKTVPAMITRVSAAKAAILTIKMNRLRRANLLADFDAIEALIDEGLSGRQIEALTTLLPQERKRRMLFDYGDKRLVMALREKRISITIAEKIAKLPPKQQAQLMNRLESTGKLRLSDLYEVKEARTRAAVDAIPQNLFARRSELRTYVKGDAHSRSEENKPQSQADRLLTILQTLKTSGALDLRNNRLSRRAVAEAKELLAQLECRSQPSESEDIEPTDHGETPKYKTQTAS